MILCVAMALTVSGCTWFFLAAFLFVSSFGLCGGFWLLLCCLIFIASFMYILCYDVDEKSQEWRKHNQLNLNAPSIGLGKLIDEAKKEKPKLKFDRRMTGSNSIDEVLQELVEYTYRDYILNWYQKLSDNDQFNYSIAQTLQRIIIAISERAKKVDIVTYITTRLVDEFASHIRLYRRTLTKVKEHRNDNSKPPCDLDSTFFDMELEMETNVCRDHICLSETCEKQYLQRIGEALMFLFLPPEDFQSKAFRCIVREVLVNGILFPTIGRLSDPDFINLWISWPCKESMFNSESFLTILKTSDNIEELQAVKEKVDLDIARQRSKDTGGDDDTFIKQQLSSLLFVKSICETRIQRLKDGLEDTDFILQGGIDLSRILAPGQKLYSLSFDVLLSNNIALSYFIEFMTNIRAQNYVFFYLTVEGYRVSAEQQISAALLSGLDSLDLETLRDAAMNIYKQYLSEKASPRLKIDEGLIRPLLARIDKGENMDTIFDDIQTRIWEILQNDPKYFAAFKKSQFYIKLLMELDLIQDGSTKPDEIHLFDEDIVSPCKSPSMQESVLDEVTSENGSLLLCEGGISLGCHFQPNSYSLSACISNTGICREHGKEYAVYLITVTKKSANMIETTWDVYRRYSDFHDLNMILQDKYDSLSGLILPSKRAFDNMNKEFLEKRKVALNTYLQTLLSPNLLNTHRGLIDMVYQFLEHMQWEREKSDLARKMDTIVNPLRSSVRNVSSIVRLMPDNFADGVARVSGGFRSIPNNLLDGVGKMLNVKGINFLNLISTVMTPCQPVTMAPQIKSDKLESGKVSASLDSEDGEDSIPLHIMLLLMDEVFDLRSRNQWLRRRIVVILQQIAKTMFGDSINRKIIDHVAYLTSPEQMAEYLKHFKDTYWPNGVLAETSAQRDFDTKMRTRIVCKTKLFGSLSEELRHLIGTETTRQGVMLVFNMFQHQKLNRRLVYIVLEGLLETIFPDNKFQETFRKLHSQSPRVMKQNKKDSATTGDIKGTSRKCFDRSKTDA